MRCGCFVSPHTIFYAFSMSFSRTNIVQTVPRVVLLHFAPRIRTIYYSFFSRFLWVSSFARTSLECTNLIASGEFQLLLGYLSSISFVRHETKYLRQFGMKFARNEYPSSGGNTSIWHVHSFTTNRKRS